MLQKKLGVWLESVSCNFHERAGKNFLGVASKNYKNYKLEKCETSKGSRSNTFMC